MGDNVLNLNVLKSGLPGVTKERSQDYLHALLVCLNDQQHQSGIEIVVKQTRQGNDYRAFRIEWGDVVTEQMLLTWNDMQEATEDAAYALAFLLIVELTRYTVIGRSAKTTGIDWWLGHKDETKTLPFVKRARLEISGILRENSESRIRSRVTQKLLQSELSDDTDLPAYVIVVEFSKPLAYVVQK